MLINKKLLAFDLHGTLSYSRCPIEADVIMPLVEVLKQKIVAVVSGSTYQQYEDELLVPMTEYKKLFGKLYLFPSEATEMYVWDGIWQNVYTIRLSDMELDKIKRAIKVIDREIGFIPNRPYGDVVTVRGGQVTVTPLGDAVPLEIKQYWDTDCQKRLVIKNKLMELLPEFSISIGGFTSININHHGMGKVKFVNEMCQRHGFEKEDILYFGNEFGENGDDQPIEDAGVECIKVRRPEDTVSALSYILLGAVK